MSKRVSIYSSFFCLRLNSETRQDLQAGSIPRQLPLCTTSVKHMGGPLKACMGENTCHRQQLLLGKLLCTVLKPTCRSISMAPTRRATPCANAVAPCRPSPCTYGSEQARVCRAEAVSRHRAREAEAVTRQAGV